MEVDLANQSNIPPGVPPPPPGAFLGGNMDKSIGALWLKESKAGNKFMSGKIDINGVSVRLVVFKNNYKDAENKPDYLIYESKPQDVPEGQATAQKVKEVFEDDIPF